MTLRTVHKGQTKVNISVFQGQAMYAKENLFLGQAFLFMFLEICMIMNLLI